MQIGQSEASEGSRRIGERNVGPDQPSTRMSRLRRLRAESESDFRRSHHTRRCVDWNCPGETDRSGSRLHRAPRRRRSRLPWLVALPFDIHRQAPVFPADRSLVALSLWQDRPRAAHEPRPGWRTAPRERGRSAVGQRAIADRHAKAGAISWRLSRVLRLRLSASPPPVRR